MRQQLSSPKEQVTTRPRDLRIGPDRPVLLWHKRKWRCRVPECERKVFTESLPEDVPARARITTRARRAAAVSIGDHCRPVSGVAAEMGMDWKIAHEAFVAYAEQVLPDAPPPVRVLGIDETRRGKQPSGAEPCRIACRATVPAEHVAGADGQGGQIQVVVAQDVLTQIRELNGGGAVSMT